MARKKRVIVFEHSIAGYPLERCLVDIPPLSIAGNRQVTRCGSCVILLNRLRQLAGLLAYERTGDEEDLVLTGETKMAADSLPAAAPQDLNARGGGCGSTQEP